VEGFKVSEIKRRKRPARMGVLNSEEHVPLGFVPLSSVKAEGGSKGLLCYITRKCNSGEVDSYCIKASTGRTVKLYVHTDDIERLKSEHAAMTVDQRDQHSQGVTSESWELIDKLLDRVEQLHVKVDRLL
jgi:hypothetical protein